MSAGNTTSALCDPNGPIPQCPHFGRCAADGLSCVCETGWRGVGCSQSQFAGFMGVWHTFRWLLFLVWFSLMVLGVLAILEAWLKADKRWRMQQYGLALISGGCFFLVLYYAVNPFEQELDGSLAIFIISNVWFDLALALMVVAYGVIMSNWITVSSRRLKTGGWSRTARIAFTCVLVLVVASAFVFSIMRAWFPIVSTIRFIIVGVVALLIGVFVLVSGISVLRRMNQGVNHSARLRRMSRQLIVLSVVSLVSIIVLAVLSFLRSPLDADPGLFIAFRVIVPQAVQAAVAAVGIFFLRFHDWKKANVKSSGSSGLTNTRTNVSAVNDTTSIALDAKEPDADDTPSQRDFIDL